MTLPVLIANDRALDDGCNIDLAHGGPIQLFEPSVIARGSVLQSLASPQRVVAAPTQYEPRMIPFEGFITHFNGHNDFYQRIHDYFKTIQGQTARIQLGSLYLDAAFGPVKIARITDNVDTMGWSIEAEAVPGLFGALYGQQVGGSQGIWVNDDRRDHSSIKYTTSVASGVIFTLTSPATAPTEIGLIISGLTSGTTYYIQNVDGRSLPIGFTPNSTWYYLSPDAGLICWPAGPGNSTGLNFYRIQRDTDGTLASTANTYVAAIAPHVTVWRFLGNDENRFTDGPVILSLGRRAKANCATATSGTSMTTSGDMQARIGLPLGGWTTAAQGLVLEGQATNVIQYPEDFGDVGETYWTKTRCTITDNSLAAPDGTTTMDTLVEDGSNNTHFMTRTAVFTGGQPGCIKVFAEASTRTWLVVGFDITDNDEIAYFNLSTGAVGTTGADVLAKIYDWGGGTYLCCVYTGSAPGTDCVVGLASADATKSYQGDGASGAYVWGVDCKALPFPDSYMPNPDALTAGMTRYADYAAVHRPHNYLADSFDLGQTRSWTVSGTGAVQPTRAGTGADGCTANTWNIVTAANNKLIQTVTPDVKPNSVPWTALFALRRGSLGGANNFDLRFEDQTGTPLGSAVTVAGQDLQTGATITVPVPITAAQIGAATANPQVAIAGNTGTGTVIIEGVSLLRGSHRGPVIITGSSGIRQPPDGWDWPTWITQNGWIQWKAVLPPISTGLTYYLLGESGSKAIALYRSSGTGVTADSAVKSTNDTTLAINSISGSPSAGNYILRVVKAGGTPADITITWNHPFGTPQSFPASGWPLGSFPLSLVGNGSAGTLVVADNGGPPVSNGTYVDTVTVTSSPYIATVARAADGGVQSSAVNVGNVWDGALHTFKVEWRNYTLSGTQWMVLLLYVDGVEKYNSGNLGSPTVTAWSGDERLWISKGEVYSTIRNLTIGAVPYSSLPAGAIPAIAG